jgi:hypothetical protein
VEEGYNGTTIAARWCLVVMAKCPTFFSVGGAFHPGGGG